MFVFVTEKCNKKVATFWVKDPPQFGTSVPVNFIGAGCQKLKDCCSMQQYATFICAVSVPEKLASSYNIAV